MNPFTQIAGVLTAKGQARRAPWPAATEPAPKSNKTQAMRDYLQNVGPATAVVLADEVGLDRADLVSALLAKDMLRGRIERVGAEYRFNHQYAAVVRAGEEDMARTLRRAGWTVTPPSTGEDQQGPFTETITWRGVGFGERPDAFTIVLLELEESAEPVWPGCWDGLRWCDTQCDPIEGLVTAWAHLPIGREGGAS